MKTILLVSSDATFSGSMSSLLASVGYEVLVSTTGERAFSLLHERGIRIDMLVADLQLHDGNAIDMVHSVKADSILKQIPVLVCSGEDSSSIIGAQLAGADDYVQKPLSFKKFLFRLSILLSRYEVTHENSAILESHHRAAHIQRSRKHSRGGAVHSGAGLSLAGSHR